MQKIYVAGKYNDTDIIKVLNNIREGIELSVKILRNGDIPFCPFLDFLFAFFGDGNRLSTRDFRNYSMEWLKVCDELWLLPSWVNSGGCKDEVEEAVKLNIPVLEEQGYWLRLNRDFIKQMKERLHETTKKD